MITKIEDMKKIHIGNNIKHIREIIGLKQEAVSIALGEDWTQKKVSVMESKVSIDTDLFDRVARIFNIPVEAIMNFDREKTIINIQNNFSNSNQGHISSSNFSSNELASLYAENRMLYERLLQKDQELLESERALLKSEREKLELLKRNVV